MNEMTSRRGWRERAGGKMRSGSHRGIRFTLGIVLLFIHLFNIETTVLLNLNTVQKFHVYFFVQILEHFPMEFDFVSFLYLIMNIPS